MNYQSAYRADFCIGICYIYLLDQRQLLRQMLSTTALFEKIEIELQLEGNTKGLSSFKSPFNIKHRTGDLINV